MDSATNVRIELLGGFRVVNAACGIDEQINVAGRSHQIWELIIYLILRRDRGVTAQELMDEMYPDMDNADPLATMKNRISRARDALARLGFGDVRRLIHCSGGFYRWQPNVAVTLDLDELEQCSAEVQSPSVTPERAAECALKAAEIYKGEFVPALAYCTWSASLGAYYHQIFVETALKAAKILNDHNRWNELE